MAVVARTFSIIKPDAGAGNLTGRICNRFGHKGLRRVAGTMVHLSREQAGAFYALHRARLRRPETAKTGIESFYKSDERCPRTR
ncbi:MAG TPA: nucleoside-diphosphate kinase [Thiohalobacter sp.]|nr:nucleoside-diphosphate kinase [Thiohalobacter sp.]